MTDRKKDQSCETTIIPMQASADTTVERPYYSEGVKAGFPSPAESYRGERIDLNHELVRHRESTFYSRVCGDSMKDAGISSGDVVVIDCELEPRDGDIVIAVIDGEYTMKYYRRDDENCCVWLIPANEDFKPIRLTAEQECMIWGVVTYTIKRFR